MGPDVQLAYEHRGRVGAQWAQRHSGAQWVCLGLLGHTGTTGTQVHRHPQATQEGGHPGPPRGTQRGLQDTHTHAHRGTGADTQPQRHTATETHSHRDTGTQ